MIDLISGGLLVDPGDLRAALVTIAKQFSLTSQRTRVRSTHLLSNQRVIDIQLHSKRQANVKQPVCHDGYRGGEAPIGENERRILPVHGFEITEDAIDDAEGGFRIRISLVIPGPTDRVLVRGGLEYCLVGLVTDVLALDRGVGGNLRTEASLILPQTHN